MASSQAPSSITPASLSYLAIFNPSLGLTDETLPDQIVFWTSRSPASQNECLRQIGLAQGIVEFARGFSGEQDLNAVETQRSRIVLHEVEAGWWILASIDLTQIHYATDPPTTDFSPREVAPPSVLIAQLKTSYRQFILFNGTLESNLSTHGRDVLVQRLEKFYTRWAWRWEVMLNGNPAVDVWNGIKIGRGVGEEEKDVLGGFAERNRTEADGSERLIDVVVSRFGNLPGDEKDPKKSKPGFSTRGTGRIPSPDDGCIYRGVGNLTKESVRDLAEWMARWYQYGDSSFDYQTIRPSRKKVRRGKSKVPASNQPEAEPATASDTADTEPAASTSAAAADTAPSDEAGNSETRLPPPLFPQEPAQNSQPSDGPSEAVPKNQKPKDKGKTTVKPSTDATNTSTEPVQEAKGSNTLMLNVLTLGTYAAYSAWNRRADVEPPKPDTPELNAELNPAEVSGRFIIGYTGALDDEDESSTGESKVDQRDFISTTIWVSRNSQDEGEDDSNNTKTPVLEECRLVAYAAYPFIFAMLFRPTNESLAKPSFYRLLHQQLGPLKGPLISSSERQYQPSNHKGVFDLIFDPATLTVHTSLPSIPEPVFNTPLDITGNGGLPRIEALHVHSQILRVIEDTRWKDIPHGTPTGERERTNRTTRGWWIAWMRLEGVEPQSKSSKAASIISPATVDSQVERQGLVPPEDDITSFIGSVTKHRRGRREAFIIRKGSDHRTHVRASKDSKSGFSIPIKLSGGLGIDTKRYFDQLLNLTART